MIDVAALGELLIDFTCLSVDADGYPTMAAHPGGAPANFLATLSKFGASTALLAKVGTDSFGRMLIERLRSVGICTDGVIADDRFFTTLAFVTLDGSGNREFSFSRKPGADTQLSFDELNLRLIDEARVFHFGTLSLTDEPSATATRRAVAYAKARGKLISYDPNLRKPLWSSLDTAKEQLLWGLSRSDVVKISDDEVEFLFGMGAAEGAAHIIDRFGVKLVFVTCGLGGCYFQNHAAAGQVPGLSGLKVVDTTGAGDIFGGSAVWKLLRTEKAPETLSREELVEITRFACVSAGLSTTKHGGISAIPEYRQVCALCERYF